MDETTRRAGGEARGPAVGPGRLGVLDALPLILGYLPFALVLGTAIASSPVPDVAGWATSPLVFAGAAQLAVLELLGPGGSVGLAIATGLIINLRHVMYSAGMAPWFRTSGTRWQLAAPFVLTDPQYSLASVRFPQLDGDRSRRHYYLGLGVSLWTAWTTMTALAIVLGNQLPPDLELGPAIPLTFLAILVPGLTDRPMMAAAITAALVSIAAAALPLQLGLLVGALCGFVVGAILDPEV